MSVLILDTSVFIKLKGAKVGAKVNAVLERHADAEIYTSEMSCFEFIRGHNADSEIVKAIEILGMCERIKVDTELLTYSTHYYRLLRRIRAVAANQLSDCDIIIGASALIYDAYLCTTDRNDFPSPYFDEVSIDELNTTEKIYVLKANKDLFVNNLKELIAAAKTKGKK